MMKFPIFSSADALAIRSKLGMNQTDFWSPFGVTQSCGSRYESNRSIPRPVQILLAAKHGKAAAKREALADGPSLNAAVKREGLVFKSLCGSQSWKVISNKWLLKHE